MYDENQAIKYINEELEKTLSVTYPDDDLLNVIDIMWDYYEENGLLDLDSDDELDIDHLIESVARLLKKDRENKIKPEHIETIVKAELDYEDSIEDDEEE